MCIKRIDIYTCWYMYVYSWITLLYTWNQHSIVNQLYFNKKGKLCHWNREELPERERGKRKNLGNRFLQEKQNGQHQTLPGCLVNSVVSDSLWPQGLYPTRLLCLWGSPGKNTGVGCHALLRTIFPTQGSNPGLRAADRCFTIWATWVSNWNQCFRNPIKKKNQVLDKIPLAWVQSKHTIKRHRSKHTIKRHRCRSGATWGRNNGSRFHRKTTH